MSSPFESNDAIYSVLRNCEGQHSLWPDSTPIPAGWNKVFGPDFRMACLAYVGTHWIDMRPISLIALDARTCSRDDIGVSGDV
jgi:MbtH protein